MSESGRLWCWGQPAFGRDAGTDAANVAEPIDEASDVEDVSPFLEESILLRRDGTVSGWGFSHHGQLGEAIAPDHTTASVLALPGVQDIAKVSAGHHHVCALTTSRQVECWGGPYSPSLGVPGVTQTQVPLALAGLDDVVDVSASVESVCVVRASGEVWCWGAVTGANGSTAFDVPTRIDGITDAIQVAAGWSHWCVLHRDGTVSCWGSNSEGEVGDGTTDARDSPVVVAGLTNVAELSAGDETSCALRTDGSVVCWGAYLGLNVPASPHGYAVVTGIGTSVHVRTSGWQSCALSNASEVHCWGRPGGTGVDRDSAPVRIEGLPQ